MTQIIWVLIIIVLSTVMVLPTVKLVKSDKISPMELKAYVFSQIMRSRYTKGKIIISNAGVRTLGNHFLSKRDFDIEYIKNGFIRYRMGFIEKAGTVYMKHGYVSFHPVTGRMVVGIK